MYHRDTVKIRPQGHNLEGSLAQPCAAPHTTGSLQTRQTLSI